MPSNIWEPIVLRIQAGDESAAVELYQNINHKSRFYLCRQIGPEHLDDHIHEVFMRVFVAIQKKRIKHPARLWAFIRTVVRYVILERLAEITIDRKAPKKESNVFDNDSNTRETMETTKYTEVDQRETPFQLAAKNERRELIEKCLTLLIKRDRDILTDFYLNDGGNRSGPEKAGLSRKQYDLSKSRALKRLSQIVKLVLLGIAPSLAASITKSQDKTSLMNVHRVIKMQLERMPIAKADIKGVT